MDSQSNGVFIDSGSESMLESGQRHNHRPMTCQQNDAVPEISIECRSKILISCPESRFESASTLAHGPNNGQLNCSDDAYQDAVQSFELSGNKNSYSNIRDSHINVQETAFDSSQVCSESIQECGSKNGPIGVQETKLDCLSKGDHSGSNCSSLQHSIAEKCSNLHDETNVGNVNSKMELSDGSCELKERISSERHSGEATHIRSIPEITDGSHVAFGNAIRLEEAGKPRKSNVRCGENSLDWDDDDLSSLSDELQQGRRILRELMSDSNKSVLWPFIDAVDEEKLGLVDYYKLITSPMWLKKMKEKFDQREYTSITEFIADFRLMLENCFRYNGPDHSISKKAQRLEMMLEQKLALLSRELREKTSVCATSGRIDSISYGAAAFRRRNRALAPHSSSEFLNQLRIEGSRREREQRRVQMMEKRAQQEAQHREDAEWERSLLADPAGAWMRAMWELPQISLFLILCQEPLNLPEVVHFEVERCFMMARESSMLQQIMTSLLSTPNQRSSLDKKPLMPYRIWEEKLRQRLRYWYRMLVESGNDVSKISNKIGLDPFFFKVVGMENPLEKRQFHQLSFYRKVWITKGLCDYCVEHHESLRLAIESQPPFDQREYILGHDTKGLVYIHFPQFCGADLRVYRHKAHPTPKISPLTPISTHSGNECSDHETTDISATSTPRTNSPADYPDFIPSSRESTPSRAATPDSDYLYLSHRLTRSSTRKINSSTKFTQDLLTRNFNRNIFSRKRRLPNQSVDGKINDNFDSENDNCSRMSDESNISPIETGRICDVEKIVTAFTSEKDTLQTVGVTENVGELNKVGDEGVGKDDNGSFGEGSSSRAVCGARGQNEDTGLEGIDRIYSAVNKREFESFDHNEIEVSAEFSTCHHLEKAKELKAGADSETVKSTDLNDGKSCGEVTPSCNIGTDCDYESKFITAYSNAASRRVEEVENGSSCAGATDESGSGHELLKNHGDAVCSQNDSAQFTQNGGHVTRTDGSSCIAECRNADGCNEDVGEVNGQVAGIHPPDTSGKCTTGSVACDSFLQTDRNDGGLIATSAVSDGRVQVIKGGDSVHGHVDDKVAPSEEDGANVKLEDWPDETMNSESEDEITPDLRDFELVAESVEQLRALVAATGENDTRRKKRSKGVGQRASLLHDRLVNLLNELEPWETKLIQATRKARQKLRNEVEKYVEVEEDMWQSDDASSTNQTADSDRESLADKTEQKPETESEAFLKAAEIKQETDYYDFGVKCRLRKRKHAIGDDFIQKRKKDKNSDNKECESLLATPVDVQTTSSVTDKQHYMHPIMQKLLTGPSSGKRPVVPNVTLRPRPVNYRCDPSASSATPRGSTNAAKPGSVSMTNAVCNLPQNVLQHLLTHGAVKIQTIVSGASTPSTFILTTDAIKDHRSAPKPIPDKPVDAPQDAPGYSSNSAPQTLQLSKQSLVSILSAPSSSIIQLSKHTVSQTHPSLRQPHSSSNQPHLSSMQAHPLFRQPHPSPMPLHPSPTQQHQFLTQPRPSSLQSSSSPTANSPNISVTPIITNSVSPNVTQVAQLTHQISPSRMSKTFFLPVTTKLPFPIMSTHTSTPAYLSNILPPVPRHGQVKNLGMPTGGIQGLVQLATSSQKPKYSAMLTVKTLLENRTRKSQAGTTEQAEVASSVPPISSITNPKSTTTVQSIQRPISVLPNILDPTKETAQQDIVSEVSHDKMEAAAALTLLHQQDPQLQQIRTEIPSIKVTAIKQGIPSESPAGLNTTAASTTSQAMNINLQNLYRYPLQTFLTQQGVFKGYVTEQGIVLLNPIINTPDNSTMSSSLSAGVVLKTPASVTNPLNCNQMEISQNAQFRSTSSAVSCNNSDGSKLASHIPLNDKSDAGPPSSAGSVPQNSPNKNTELLKILTNYSKFTHNQDDERRHKITSSTKISSPIKFTSPVVLETASTNQSQVQPGPAQNTPNAHLLSAFSTSSMLSSSRLILFNVGGKLMTANGQLVTMSAGAPGGVSGGVVLGDMSGGFVTTKMSTTPQLTTASPQKVVLQQTLASLQKYPSPSFILSHPGTVSISNSQASANPGKILNAKTVETSPVTSPTYTTNSTVVTHDGRSLARFQLTKQITSPVKTYLPLQFGYEQLKTRVGKSPMAVHSPQTLGQSAISGAHPRAVGLQLSMDAPISTAPKLMEALNSKDGVSLMSPVDSAPKQAAISYSQGRLIQIRSVPYSSTVGSHQIISNLQNAKLQPNLQFRQLNNPNLHQNPNLLHLQKGIIQIKQNSNVPSMQNFLNIQQKFPNLQPSSANAEVKLGNNPAVDLKHQSKTMSIVKGTTPGVLLTPTTTIYQFSTDINTAASSKAAKLTRHHDQEPSTNDSRKSQTNFSNISSVSCSNKHFSTPHSSTVWLQQSSLDLLDPRMSGLQAKPTSSPTQTTPVFSKTATIPTFQFVANKNGNSPVRLLQTLNQSHQPTNPQTSGGHFVLHHGTLLQTANREQSSASEEIKTSEHKSIITCNREFLIHNPSQDEPNSTIHHKK